MTLAANTLALWDKYVDAEKDRLRDATLTALEPFIEALLQNDDATWKAWARDFAARVSEGKLEVPVRLPLFRRVLLPALAEGVLRGEAGSARSLAHFQSHLVHTKDLPLPANLQTTWGLLSEAVRVDPDDAVARSRLVEEQGDYLEYALHELPTCVLYGQNSATVAQCEMLLDLLGEFRAHVAALGLEASFEELMADCELHFNAYRHYLVSGRARGSYEEFLQTRTSDDG